MMTDDEAAAAPEQADSSQDTLSRHKAVVQLAFTSNGFSVNCKLIVLLPGEDSSARRL
jgi:hypothetical protein